MDGVEVDGKGPGEVDKGEHKRLVGDRQLPPVIEKHVVEKHRHLQLC